MDSCGNISDPSCVGKQSHVSRNFAWPKESVVEAQGELEAPLVDLDGFIRGDQDATRRAAELVSRACLTHGFFQVINHGIDSRLVEEAYQQLDAFFKLPLHRKSSLPKTAGSMWGYSGAHAHRFSRNLPWKETLSFPFHHSSDVSEPVVSTFFTSNIGQDFQHAGMVFQKYCEGMKELGLKLMELLGISLGVERWHYREFFEDGECIMRCNYYPPCHEPGLALGTGPHCDPTSLTILHQDDVGGLDVFTDDKWQRVPPRPHALVVNIGDTFSALSNGRYKSCVHRAVVKRYKERRSMAFFVCPKGDKVVRPPQDLVLRDGATLFPHFTWSDFLLFTQSFYRADHSTLHHFTRWLLSSKPSSA
ncbi:gibberellin 20 oxidase 3-like [Prosopis cineraria]|uniref:gibberellin 20 oxidase 3-like n=1 Tax=Prosopis cineraria TaxID=364024 RepID=UPI00240F3133|nr:gibberellin 20 oxidase 3-like [Prosopis cineraria]